MSGRFLAMLAGVAALAILAAGCGGSDDEALTKAEFVDQGKAICADTMKELKGELDDFAKEHELDKSASKKQTAEVTEEVILPQLQAQVDELRELSPPEAEEEKIASMLDKLETGIEEGEEDPANFFFSDNDNQFYEGRSMILEYGLEGCATVF